MNIAYEFVALTLSELLRSGDLRRLSTVNKNWLAARHTCIVPANVCNGCCGWCRCAKQVHSHFYGRTKVSVVILRYLTNRRCECLFHLIIQTPLSQSLSFNTCIVAKSPTNRRNTSTAVTTLTFPKLRVIYTDSQWCMSSTIGHTIDNKEVSVKDVMSACPKLTEYSGAAFDYTSLPTSTLGRLTTLTIHMGRRTHWLTPTVSNLKHLPALTELNLATTYSADTSAGLYLQPRDVPVVIPRYLATLRLQLCCDIQPFFRTYYLPRELISACLETGTLTTLFVHMPFEIQLTGQQYLLRCVYLRGCVMPGSPSVLEDLPALESLVIRDCQFENVQEEQVNFVSLSSPKLRHLSVNYTNIVVLPWNCSKLTPLSVEILSVQATQLGPSWLPSCPYEKLTRLKWLKITDVTSEQLQLLPAQIISLPALQFFSCSHICHLQKIARVPCLCEDLTAFATSFRDPAWRRLQFAELSCKIRESCVYRRHWFQPCSSPFSNLIWWGPTDSLSNDRAQWGVHKSNTLISDNDEHFWWNYVQEAAASFRTLVYSSLDIPKPGSSWWYMYPAISDSMPSP